MGSRLLQFPGKEVRLARFLSPRRAKCVEEDTRDGRTDGIRDAGLHRAANSITDSSPIPTAQAKTQNARRILQYQRQIKHWLDDEEALAAQAAAFVPGPRSAAATQARRQSTRPSISIPPTPSDAATPAPQAQGHPTPVQTLPTDPNVDPILSVQKMLPLPIHPTELEALLSAPPLLYGASFAAPPATGGPPQRKFCDNCGYWGNIKCLKCGGRVCSLECKDAHEATRCLKWA
jgi:zinc finger HIT domain-containing protein 1